MLLPYSRVSRVRNLKAILGALPHEKLRKRRTGKVPNRSSTEAFVGIHSRGLSQVPGERPFKNDHIPIIQDTLCHDMIPKNKSPRIVFRNSGWLLQRRPDGNKSPNHKQFRIARCSRTSPFLLCKERGVRIARFEGPRCKSHRKSRWLAVWAMRVRRLGPTPL